MAIAFVNSAINGGSSVTSVAVTYSPSAGNTLVVGVALLTTGFTVTSVTDNAGNVYKLKDFQNKTVNICRVEVWWCHNIVGSPTSITANLSGTAGQAIIAVGEYSGIAADGLIFSNTGSTALTTNTVNSTDANSWSVSFFAASGSGTFTASVGTLRQSLVQGAALGGGLIDTTTASQHGSLNCRATISVSEQWATDMMELRPVSPTAYITDDITYGVGPLAAPRAQFFDQDVLIFLPPAPQAPTLDLTNDAEAQRFQFGWPTSDGDLADAGVELVQYGPGVLGGWDVPSEQQLSSALPFRNNHLSDEGVELITTAQLITGVQFWDTDGEAQRLFPAVFGSDDVADSAVELVQYGPGVIGGWDAAEVQLQQLPQFSANDVADAGVELIQYSPGVLDGWDTDADQQKLQPATFSLNDVADSAVELIQYGPGVLSGWDQDAEQQLAQPGTAKNHLADEGVELISLPPLVTGVNFWDTDAEPQMLQAVPFGQDDLADTGIELIQYGPGVLEGWDTDAQQQKAQPDVVKDHLSDEGVEQITLPPLVTQVQFWDTDAEPQLRQIPPFGQDDLTDSTVELVQYGPGVLTGWDVPTEGQPVAQAKTFDAEEDRQWINYIVLPPFVFNQDWTTDAESQRPSPATVSVDSQEERDQPDFLILPPAPWTSEQEAQLQQAGVNSAALASDAGQGWTMLIIVPPSVPTTPWDTDAAQQLMVLPLRFADPHAPEWTNFPLGSPVVQRALAALKAQIVTQLAARSGQVIPKLGAQNASFVGKLATLGGRIFIPKLAAQSAQLVGKIVSLGGRIIY